MDKEPFVSVVVPTYNRKNFLRDCIESLFTQTYPRGRYEIIVVDDGSTDGTKEFLANCSEENPQLKYFSQKNQGSAEAKNIGIKNSIGEIICFTDDDCIADKDWIRSLVRRYGDENVAGVGGPIIASGTGSMMEAYAEKSHFFSQESFIDVSMIGGNSSFRKDVLDELKGFDPFFRNGQDTEIAIRTRNLGYAFRLAPDALIYHKHKETLKGVLEQGYRYERTYARLHKKYTKNFNPGPRLAFLFKKLLRKTAVTPLKFVKVFWVKDRSYYLTEHFIDLWMLGAMVLGIINGTFFSKPYTEKKIEKRLDFLDKANMPGGWGL